MIQAEGDRRLRSSRDRLKLVTLTDEAGNHEILYLPKLESSHEPRVGTNTRHMVDMGQGLNIKPLTSPNGLHILSLRALPPLLGIRY